MLSTFHLKPSTQRRSAFTLIELLGVMAIIGILAAVTLPSMIGKIESARVQSEDANLEEIARALVEGIQKRGQFPNPALANGAAGSWTDIAQSFTSLGPDALANVLPINNPRRIVFSDDLTAYLGGTFVQPAAGWVAPPASGSLVIYILSSSKNGELLSTGAIPLTGLASWTKAFDATRGYIPAPASVFASGKQNIGEFFHVKAIDVRSLFCAVKLTDFPVPTSGQVTSSGSGFTPGTPYQGQAAGCSFTFTAPAYVGAVVVGFDIAPPTTSLAPTVGPKTLIQRTGLTSTALTGVIPPPDRSIASLNARNTLAANLLSGPYATAYGASDPASAVTAVSAANIDNLVSSTVPPPTGLGSLQSAYNTAKANSDAKQAAASADPSNTDKANQAAAALQATASAKTALDAAQAAASTQSAANSNAVAAANSNAVNAALTEAANPNSTAPSVAIAAANAAANAAAAQVFTSPASFSITIGYPPWWTIGGLAGQQMPPVGNNQIFYVLRGTSLALYTSADVIPRTPILTLPISADSTFEYFNDSWTRVD